MKKLFIILFLLPTSLIAETSKHEVSLNGQKINVEIAKDGTEVNLLKGNKKFANWKKRNLLIDTGKAVSVIKLSNKEDTEYLLFHEELEMYTYRSWIVGVNEQGKASSIYTGHAIGQLEDFDKDGLLDFLKTGGKGEPTSDQDGSYDPYLVYKQKRNGKEIGFELDEESSKKYSLSMGHEWHGSKYNSKIKVNQKTGKILK